MHMCCLSVCKCVDGSGARYFIWKRHSQLILIHYVSLRWPTEHTHTHTHTHTQTHTHTHTHSHFHRGSPLIHLLSGFHTHLDAVRCTQCCKHDEDSMAAHESGSSFSAFGWGDLT